MKHEHSPAISPATLRFFRAYTRRFLARNFHAVRRSGEFPALDSARPAIVFLNHSSWWDPLTCLFLGEHCFPARPAFAPMDAAQLARYGFFRKLGMFGVEPGTRRGAAAFLRAGADVLARPGAMLWLTPQARFADVRERPLRFAGGLAHLARRHPGAVLVPLAIEYPFWEERRPELLVRFGEPMSADADSTSLASQLELQLATTMDALASDGARRNPAAFRTLLEGGRGVSWTYDWWRRTRAALRGEAFSPGHNAARR